MKTKIVYFVHGTTEDNLQKKCSGWKDVNLSELGKEQAKKLGETVDYEFDVLFSSDLGRAITSANIAFPSVLKYQDKRLRECNYGILDGQDKNLVVYEDHISTPFEDGESLLDVEKRVREFLNFLIDNYEGKTIAIMAHRAPQLALDVILKSMSWEAAIKNDWRKSGSWQPGWEYIIDSDTL